MRLLGSEPPVPAWQAWDLAAIAASLLADPTQDVTVIAVDGRSGGGKTTFARALATQTDAALLSTDDVAWWHSCFDWPELLIDNVLAPLRAGQSVDYRPPAWIERGREGAITAPSRPVLVVEGVGSAQLRMRPAVDRIVWLQSDADESERRGIARDLSERPDPAEARRFWDAWMAEETPFQEEQRTWAVADLVVCGTPAALGPDPAPRWLCDRPATGPVPGTRP